MEPGFPQRRSSLSMRNKETCNSLHYLQMSHTGNPSSLCVSGGCGNRDMLCPVCLQTASVPVETNCGHLFCATCLISYWRHGVWLDAISCPLCRQRVSVLCQVFGEASGREEPEALRHIREYNQRFSGAPRQMTACLFDAPLILLLMLRGAGQVGGLVFLFLLRVAVCGFGAALSLTTPLEAVPGTLGLLDDLVVIFLVLVCVINTRQQLTTERAAAAHTPEHAHTDASAPQAV